MDRHEPPWATLTHQRQLDEAEAKHYVTHILRLETMKRFFQKWMMNVMTKHALDNVFDIFSVFVSKVFLELHIRRISENMKIQKYENNAQIQKTRKNNVM